MAKSPGGLGRINYEAYRESVGHRSVHGEQLPEWPDLADHVRAAWVAAARAVLTADGEAGQ
ncbi:hypothetical protein JHN59_08580 [Streptomyces sp. MBT49]|uniref:hypothetical protein n=1 Tax=unclassified Streptomyces TaxID=2593676 RepID=UPI00190C7C9B|nr:MULTISPECIES: hypothetical protein [unclassified Streptomyces]MBK3624902.1 hypothetical protein [Streptomyces sp. MBT49]MBK3632546.1 hypothetical protein [Streptomyces sp. MBT97]